MKTFTLYEKKVALPSACSSSFEVTEILSIDLNNFYCRPYSYISAKEILLRGPEASLIIVILCHKKTLNIRRRETREDYIALERSNIEWRFNWMKTWWAICFPSLNKEMVAAGLCEYYARLFVIFGDYFSHLTCYSLRFSRKTNNTFTQKIIWR